jgi:hypothetical protein
MSVRVGRRWWAGFALLGAIVACGPACWAAEPVALRVENVLVSPSHGPLARVAVKNLLPTAYRGVVRLAGPAGWRIVPAQREVSLAPGQVERVAFNVERGQYVEANEYAMVAAAEGAGAVVSRKQTICCASAPYFKPAIEAKPDQWKEAIPVSFLTAGKRTTLSTHWSRNQFSFLVAVEETALSGLNAAGRPCDAVQIAISAAGSTTGTQPDQPAGRYEFLLAWTGSGSAGKCFLLAKPDTKLAEAAQCRKLAGLEYDKAQVQVSRAGSVTYYAGGIPFKLMREEIPPSEGREFCLSVLVHDPDGTGIRDWGQAAGLWPWQRSRWAWSLWDGAKWGAEPPMDNKTEWGLCASKY